MSRNCKLPDCYPVSINNININDTFQNSNDEAIFYSLDLEPVSLPIGEYNNDSLNLLEIDLDNIYKIDIPNSIRVTLFSNDNLKGNNLVLYNNNNSNLETIDFKITSILIENSSLPSIINTEYNTVLPTPVLPTPVLPTPVLPILNNSNRWINGISNITVIIILIILLIIIIFKK